MNMFARFDENPAMTLRVIKETKRYGRTDGRTDARTDGQRENSIPPTNKVCGGYKNVGPDQLDNKIQVNLDINGSKVGDRILKKVMHRVSLLRPK